MTPLTIEQATAMLDLQDRLNPLLQPDWEKKNHLRRAWQETATLLDALEDRTSSVSVAFTDVWHALMCEWLKNVPKDEGVDDAAALLISTMYDERFWSAKQQEVLSKHTDLPTLADAFVHMCSAGMFNAKLFERMMELWNMTWTDMFDMTVPEDLVNVFVLSLPEETKDVWAGWVYEWARELVDQSPITSVVERLNALEVAYAAEVARRAA